MPLKARPAPVAVVAGWTGMYFGVNGGGGFGRTPANTFGLFGATLGFPGASGSYGLGHEMTGAFGGAQAGVNWQTGAWVWGLEADIQGADIKGTGRINGLAVTQLNGIGGAPGNFTSAIQRIDTFGTLRARAGFLPTPDLLLYGTAGLMGADLQTSGNFFFSGVPINLAATKTSFAAGWTAGAGFEYKWSGNWSVKGEYLYYDLGNRSLVSNFGTPVAAPPFQAQYNFGTRGSLARIGVNYHWGDPSLGNAYAADLPVKAVKAAPLSMWQFEVGARYFYSSGRTRFNLFDPFATAQLNSRLTYRELDSNAGEGFARVDHVSGFFAKGFLGGGNIFKGPLNDEDFPPALVPYSNTISSVKNGSLNYGTIDAGWNFWQTPTAKVGAFVGYNRFYENANAYGCQQVATNPAICGLVTINPAVLVLSKTDTWDSLRVGANGVFNIAEQWKVTLDGAYLPYVRMSGFDNHWLRPDINPLPQAGRGWGYQLEGIVSYDVTRNLSVGAGGRYWYARTTTGTTQFPGVPASPTTFSYDRYGGFLQASYKFETR